MARDLIFFSYRRDDTADVAGRIHDAFADRFGPARLFKDVNDIPPGADFGVHIAEVLARCSVALVLIGPQWADARDAQGRRRLDDPADWVRVEVEAALQRDGVRVVPVLINGAGLPPAEALPPGLQPLLRRQTAVVRRDPDFRDDVQRLMRSLGPRRRQVAWLAAGAVLALAAGAVALPRFVPGGWSDPAPGPAPAPAPHGTSKPAPRVGPEPGSLADWQHWIGDGRIYFAIDRATLDDAGRASLAEQATWLARYPAYRIRVIGHAADEGVAGGVSRAYALKLSARRADAVRDALVAAGVDAQRIETLAMGREQPLDRGSGAEADARNRHVQVVPYRP